MLQQMLLGRRGTLWSNTWIKRVKCWRGGSSKVCITVHFYVYVQGKLTRMAYWHNKSIHWVIFTSAPPQKTLRMMRAYTRLVGSHWPSQQWRLNKQWIIFRSYASYLTKLSAGNVTFARYFPGEREWGL